MTNEEQLMLERALDICVNGLLCSYAPLAVIDVLQTKLDTLRSELPRLEIPQEFWDAQTRRVNAERDEKISRVGPDIFYNGKPG